MRKLVLALLVSITIGAMATPADAAGKGKPTAQPSAAASAPAPKSSVAAAQRIQITVTGTVVDTPTAAADTVTVQVKTTPQGKNKLGYPTKGSTITVVRDGSAGAAFSLKRNGEVVADGKFGVLKNGDKVTIKIVAFDKTANVYSAQAVTASGS